jgi:hypothetical protein
MFQTYASTSLFDSLAELESFNRENVCFCGPDALDGSAVVYICLSRLKPDHLKIMNSILVRIYMLCAAASKRTFNILVDCSAAQASSAAVITVIKDLTTTLIAGFEPAAKKRLKHVFLVHPSVEALRDIQAFLADVAPRLLHKVKGEYGAGRYFMLVVMIMPVVMAMMFAI